MAPGKSYMVVTNRALTQQGVCLAGVLALHVALISLVWAERRAAPSRNAAALRELVPLRAEFLSDEPSIESAGAQVIGGAPTLDELVIRVPPPALESIAADSLQPSRPVVSALDATDVEQLQGIYRSQLLARVARLFDGRRMQSANGDPCVVNVVQNERGTVLDVMTDLCTATEEEREMIARVIRRASPLPLPPTGLARGSYLTLDITKLLAPSQAASSE